MVIPHILWTGQFPIQGEVPDIKAMHARITRKIPTVNLLYEVRSHIEH